MTTHLLQKIPLFSIYGTFAQQGRILVHDVHLPAKIPNNITFPVYNADDKSFIQILHYIFLER